MVSYLGHGRFDGSLYIYLEYMPGGSLAQVLQQYGRLEESLLRVRSAYTESALAWLGRCAGRLRAHG